MGRAKAQHSTLKRLTADLQNLVNRRDLLPQTEMERRGQGEAVMQERSTADVLRSARTVQDDSIASVERSKQLVNESYEIGVNTTGVLGQQREQLVNTSKQLDNIEDELRRADLI